MLEIIDIVAQHYYQHYIVKEKDRNKEPCIPFLFYDSLLQILRTGYSFIHCKSKQKIKNIG